jgi:hypothetical protein
LLPQEPGDDPRHRTEEDAKDYDEFTSEDLRTELRNRGVKFVGLMNMYEMIGYLCEDDKAYWNSAASSGWLVPPKLGDRPRFRTEDNSKDYRKFTKEDMRTEMRNRGVKYTHRMGKHELTGLLCAGDKDYWKIATGRSWSREGVINRLQ